MMDIHAATPMRVPLDIGTIHFIGIGGIGMSGIAEIMHNLGYKVRGSDLAESANVKRLQGARHPDLHRPQRRQSQGCPCRRLFLGGEGRQSRIRCGAPARPAAGAPRRNAGRDHAPEMVRRRGRHQRQDHDHHHGRGPARCRRARSHRRQWRHHQRLWHQCAAGRGRLGGGRGRRERRHLPAPAGHRFGRHQYRSRPSRFLRQLREDARGLPQLRRACAVLRLRGDVPRSSRSAGHGRPDPRPPRHHLWLQPPGRCPRGRRQLLRRRLPFRRRGHRPAGGHRNPDREDAPAHAGRAQCAERAGRHRRGARAGRARRHDPHRLRRFRRRPPALHPRRRMERRRHHRRLRPQPVQDRRRVEGRAPGLFAARSSPWSSRIATRACAIPSSSSRPASTMPMSPSSRRSIRPARSRIEGYRPRHLCGIAARPWPSQCARHRRAGRSAGHGRRTRQAGRRHRLPRRGLDHRLGRMVSKRR